MFDRHLVAIIVGFAKYASAMPYIDMQVLRRLSKSWRDAIDFLNQNPLTFDDKIVIRKSNPTKYFATCNRYTKKVLSGIYVNPRTKFELNVISRQYLEVSFLFRDMIRARGCDEDWENYLLDQFDFRDNFQFINTLLVIGERLDLISREMREAKKRGCLWSCQFAKIPDTVCSEKFVGRFVRNSKGFRQV